MKKIDSIKSGRVQKKAGASILPSIPKESTKLPLLHRPAIILAIAVLALYANTTVNGFVHDDFSAIVYNKIVSQGISAIPEIFTTPYHHGYAYVENGLYRPIPLSIEFRCQDSATSQSA